MRGFLPRPGIWQYQFSKPSLKSSKKHSSSPICPKSMELQMPKDFFPHCFIWIQYSITGHTIWNYYTQPSSVVHYWNLTQQICFRAPQAAAPGQVPPWASQARVGQRWPGGQSAPGSRPGWAGRCCRLCAGQPAWPSRARTAGGRGPRSGCPAGWKPDQILTAEHSPFWRKDKEPQCLEKRKNYSNSVPLQTQVKDPVLLIQNKVQQPFLSQKPLKIIKASVHTLKN